MASDPFDTWTWQNDLPQGNPINQVIRKNGLYIGVGGGGTIMVSEDGKDWHVRNSICGINDNLTGVEYSKGIFVVVGFCGTILISPNGKNWDRIGSGTSAHLKAVLFAKNIFVAVGFGGTLLYSNNGITWKQSDNSDTTEDLYGITYGKELFVAVGENGTTLYSENGKNWSNTSIGDQSTLYGVAYGRNQFLAVGSGSILRSSNGKTWHLHSTEQHWLMGIAYGKGANGRFVAVRAAEGVASVIVSEDGINWQKIDPGRSVLHNVTYSGGCFIASGCGGKIMTSLHGEVWASLTKGLQYSLYGIAYGNNRLAAVGLGGGSILVSSNNGLSWVERQIKNLCLDTACFGVIFAHGMFIAIGTFGIATSPDGTSWTIRETGINKHLCGISLVNNLVIAVGDSGTIMVSPDGINWTASVSGVETTLRGVSYGNGIFMAVGDEETVLVSSDLLSWQKIQVDLGDNNASFYGVCYGASTFAVIGVKGCSGCILATKDNGATWQVNHQPLDMYAVTFVKDTFVAVGRYIILTSSNGINWTRRAEHIQEYLRGMTSSSSYLWVAGAFGVILRSGKLN